VGIVSPQGLDERDGATRTSTTNFWALRENHEWREGGEEVSIKAEDSPWTHESREDDLCSKKRCYAAHENDIMLSVNHLGVTLDQAAVLPFEQGDAQSLLLHYKNLANLHCGCIC
jgi:hypothetical protein